MSISHVGFREGKDPVSGKVKLRSSKATQRVERMSTKVEMEHHEEEKFVGTNSIRSKARDGKVADCTRMLGTKRRMQDFRWEIISLRLHFFSRHTSHVRFVYLAYTVR